MSQPIKRALALQSFSREHHYALLLCWKIQMGFSKNAELLRMKKYADWFYKNYLIKHFEDEEKYVFDILGNDHELIIEALNQHEHLRQLFLKTDDVENTLKSIQSDLDAHVRFEERILFNVIQQHASEAQMELIIKIHQDDDFADNFEDVFWQ